MLILFVGDQPSPRMKPGALPFEGAACEERLKSWIHEHIINIPGIPISYKIINQCDFSHETLQAFHETNGYRIVALGNNAAKALKGIPHFKLPHPSGRNRQINDALFIKMRLSECKDWLRQK